MNESTLAFQKRIAGLDFSTPHALPGKPADYGIAHPEILLSVDPETMFRYLYRASAVRMSVSFSFRDDDDTVISSFDSVICTRRRDSGDFVSGPAGEETHPPTIRENMIIRESLPRVGGSIQVSRKPADAQESFSAYGLTLNPYKFYMQGFAFFMDTRKRYMLPGLSASLGIAEINRFAGSFLGYPFAYQADSPNQSIRRTAMVDVAFSGADLPL